MLTKTSASSGDISERYLNLLKRSLVRWDEDEFVPIQPGQSKLKNLAKYAIQKAIALQGAELLKRHRFNASQRENGRDWPAKAVTMIGTKRLDNIQHCIETVIRDDVPGDLVETGVWRGGGSIFMRACLEAFGDDGRAVWCADSFQGLPAPDLERYPQDKDVDWHTKPQLAISLEEVKDNFRKFNLLDDRVKFLVGWFKDTLPTAPIESISVLRLDGDMYESTMDALDALYSKVSPGGFIIVDDYGIPEDTCRRAIHDFREVQNISAPIIDIDGWGAYWRRIAVS
jgi:O-methyltransferase